MKKHILILVWLALGVACSSGDEQQSQQMQEQVADADEDDLDSELNESNSQANGNEAAEEQGSDDESLFSESEDNSLDNVGGNQNTAQTNGGNFANNAPVQNTQIATNAAPGNATPVNAVPVNSAPLAATPAQDATPVLDSLKMLTYDYSEKSVTVALKTMGDANFALLQEFNKSNQPELVVRLLDTTLHGRMRKALVADEFRSPVAYVRTRQNAFENYTDVLVTLRDPVRPKLYASGSDIRLTYDVPNRYWGSAPVAPAAYTRAELMDADMRPDGYTAPTPPDRSAPYVPDAAPAQNVAPVEAPANPAPTEEVPQPVVIPDNNTVNVEELPNTVDVQNSYDDQGLPKNNFSNDAQGNNSQPVVINGQNVNNSEDYNFQDNQNAGNNAQSNNTQSNESNSQGNNSNVNAGGALAPAGAGSGNISRNSNYPNNQQLNQSNGNQNAPVNEQLNQQSNQQSNQQTNEQQYEENEGEQEYEQQENDIDFDDSDDFDSEGDSEDDIEKFEVRNGDSFGFWTVAQDDLFSDGEDDGESGNSQQSQTADVVGTDINEMRQVSGVTKMNLDFRGAPLTDVVRAIANESKLNFTIPPNLGTSRVYLSLMGVPWDQALKAVLESNGLAMVKMGDNLYRIDNLAVLAAELQRVRATQQGVESLAPTKVLIVRLSYATASNVSSLVTSLMNQNLPTGAQGVRVQIDTRTNSLLIEGTVSQLAKAKSLIERIDLRTPQVEIISRIVEVSKSNNDAFGISWSVNSNLDANNGLGFGGLTFPNNLRSRFTVDPGIPSTVGQLGVRMGSINGSVDLTAILAFEESRGTTEILQSNRVVVQDNQAASIVGGSTDYFITSNSGTTIVTGGGQSGGSTVSAVNFNISLNVTPQISVDGTVQMVVALSSTTPKSSASATAQVGSSNRNINTTLRNKSGETAVIGGLWDTLKEKTVTGIPFLSNLPIIGHLFKTTRNNDIKRELLIMLTPRILDAGGQALRQTSSTFSRNENTTNANSLESNNTNTADGELDGGNVPTQNAANSQESNTQSNNSQGNNTQEANTQTQGNFTQSNNTQSNNTQSNNAQSQQATDGGDFQEVDSQEAPANNQNSGMNFQQQQGNVQQMNNSQQGEMNVEDGEFQQEEL